MAHQTLHSKRVFGSKVNQRSKVPGRPSIWTERIAGSYRLVRSAGTANFYFTRQSVPKVLAKFVHGNRGVTKTVHGVCLSSKKLFTYSALCRTMKLNGNGSKAHVTIK